jgi:hypothetical protein
MLYPQKGNMAKGSRRTWPMLAEMAAAVISEPTMDHKNTP